MQQPDTTDGLFHSGDPLTGTKGTPITATFLNSVVLELVNVLTAANIPLDPADSSQLLAAIDILCGNVPIPVACTTADVYITLPVANTTAARRQKYLKDDDTGFKVYLTDPTNGYQFVMDAQNQVTTVTPIKTHNMWVQG